MLHLFILLLKQFEFPSIHPSILPGWWHGGRHRVDDISGGAAAVSVSSGQGEHRLRPRELGPRAGLGGRAEDQANATQC